MPYSGHRLDVGRRDAPGAGRPLADFCGGQAMSLTDIGEEMAKLRASGAFDADWYASHYGDVPRGIDPLEHYIRIGRKLGRRGVDPVRAKNHVGVIGGTTTWTFSIIVPVHNALSDVKLCLASIIKNSFPAHELIIVNDGSDAETSLWLESFVSKNPAAKLVVHKEALGYTNAVNAGFVASSGQILVIQNSDTIVPPFWLERLAAPLEYQDIAAVGPVSNAATWQSIPDVKSDDGAWAVNDLISPEGVDATDRLVFQTSANWRPDEVSLLNGFCYAVRRSVFEVLGGLDGSAFPSGYGEETDFFLRMASAGHRCVVVPNLYVYHAKSKSFGSERRSALSAKGNEILYARYGRERIREAAATLQNASGLIRLRNELNGLERVPRSDTKPNRVHIVFLLPVRPGGGGVHSVVQEASGLHALGYKVTICVPGDKLPDYARYYPKERADGFFTGFAGETDILAHADAADVVVATHFKSIRLLQPCYERYIGTKLFLYYVQDYEPWIVPDGSRDQAEAIESYTLCPNMLLVAKTHWICRQVKQRHNVNVYKIAPSIDRTIYNTQGRLELPDQIRLAAMLRPRTPRRGAEQTLEVLEALGSQFDRLSVSVFGATEAELDGARLRLPAFVRNYGVLVREQVAQVLRDTDLFIDMSSYQAFGRTALEAMACGAAAAIPEQGGGDEYSWCGVAALPIPTDQPNVAAERIVRLLTNKQRLKSAKEHALRVANAYDLTKAAISLDFLIKSNI